MQICWKLHGFCLYLTIGEDNMGKYYGWRVYVDGEVDVES